MKNKLTRLILIVIFLSLFINPTITITSVNSAINVFLYNVFPAIFPYLLISDLLIKYNFDTILNKLFSPIIKYLFHVDKSSTFIIIFSILCGFPSGTKFIKDFLDKKEISIDTANYLIFFTNYSNPLFILGTVYLLIKNKKLTYLILISHILSNIIIGIIMRPKTIKKEILQRKQENKLPFSENLSNSIKNTFKITLMILGNSIFAFLISSFLNKYINQNISFIIDGILDLSKGIITISKTNYSIVIKSLIILITLSFSGLNVHLQVLNIIKNTNIKYRNFFLGRILQITISILVFVILISILT